MEPDGGAFTDFLAKLNDPVFGEAATASDVTGCFARHCNWRLLSIVELVTILDCGDSGCMDPIFVSWQQFYWSASTLAGFPDRVWLADFKGDSVGNVIKTSSNSARAVRTGSWGVGKTRPLFGTAAKY